MKAVGRGHSFNDIALTDGVLISLDGLRGVREVDRSTGRVTVGAGTPLHELNEWLAVEGLALRNLGDIDRQTVAGAISTGTHGTGLQFGGLATQVVGLDLVLADGSTVTCSSAQQPDLFAAARVGLGALGVIASATLACVEAFALHAVETPMALDEVLERLDELAATNEHFEFYWFPHTGGTLSKRNNRVTPGSSPGPLRPLRRFFYDEVLSNGIFELTNRLGSLARRTIPPVNRLATRLLPRREYVDASYRVFTSPRRVRFREMEYAIPAEAVRDVAREIARWLERSGERVSFPLEVRFGAADDIWLSTAFGRTSAYVSVHQYHGMDHRRWFEAAEAILWSAGGRPHWGKMHTRVAADLRTRYPRFEDYLAVRRHLDPAGAFSNPYLDRVLGSPGGSC